MNQSTASPISVAELMVSSTGKLSTRESEVLELRIQGKSTKAIATELNISLYTVKGHTANLMTKLGIYGAPAFAQYLASEREERRRATQS